MKKLLLAALALVIAYQLANRVDGDKSAVERAPPAASAIERDDAPSARRNDVGTEAIDDAFANQRANVQVEASGVVSKVLKDDNDGSRHQRFIVKLSSGLTVLVAHNIDLAPRVEGLEPGDAVSVYGEYEWNSKGGVIHWTHHDPQGRHVAGWISHDGRTYQ